MFLLRNAICFINWGFIASWRLEFTGITPDPKATLEIMIGTICLPSGSPCLDLHSASPNSSISPLFSEVHHSIPSSPSPQPRLLIWAHSQADCPLTTERHDVLQKGWSCWQELGVLLLSPPKPQHHSPSLWTPQIHLFIYPVLSFFPCNIKLN